MSPRKLLPALLVVFSAFASQYAKANTVTGTFNTDDQVNFYTTTLTSSQTFNVNTTSYAAGGFDPVLTLFYANGSPIAPSMTGGTADPVTGLSNDAYISQLLGPGTYLLSLSEFPNGATNGANDPFLFAGMGNFTPSLCPGSTGTSFLESDVAPCVQRTGNFAFTSNVTLAPAATVTPEPATWILVLPATGLLLAFGKRSIA
jgi:hypothetical protein